MLCQSQRRGGGGFGDTVVEGLKLNKLTRDIHRAISHLLPTHMLVESHVSPSGTKYRLRVQPSFYIYNVHASISHNPDKNIHFISY